MQARWVLANGAGSPIGFGVFAVIAHGLVSPHDEEHATLAQFAAHTLGLLPAGAIIALGYRLVLERYTVLARWFVPATSMSMTIAFLIGAYGLRPPFDFLFGYAAVGAVLEAASNPIHKRQFTQALRAAVATSLLFAAGSFLGMLALSLVARAFAASFRRAG